MDSIGSEQKVVQLDHVPTEGDGRCGCGRYKYGNVGSQDFFTGKSPYSCQDFLLYLTSTIQLARRAGKGYAHSRSSYAQLEWLD